MPILIDKIDDQTARSACTHQGNRPEALIEILHEIQRRSGFVSDAAIATIADALNLSRAEVLGVVSFYHDFKRQPGARHQLKICRAEACQAAGGEQIAAEVEARLIAMGVAGGSSPALDIESVYCLGNCALGPAALLDESPVGRIDADKLVSRLAAIGMVEAEPQ